MTRLVLVHGAWHGAWAWDKVTTWLEPHGVECCAISLPGSEGPSLHNANGQAVTLVDQARTLIETLRSARPAVVVAHSHGGLVVQEAAAMDRDLVSAVIAIDAWFAERDEAFMETVPDGMRQWLRSAVRQTNGMTVIPPPPPAAFGINDASLAAEVRSRLAEQPLGTFDAPSSGFNFAQAGIPGVAIVCEPRTLPFDRLAERHGFSIRSITSGHNVMLLEPRRLASVLLQSVRHLDFIAGTSGERVRRTPVPRSDVGPRGKHVSRQARP
ncbi:Alpha/beta hydrolase family protein [Actinopolymorpha cephalotaxi]|uniref:Alpha/beta hydrolase family protein n=2 Tax=Actinopolymorpha cephalotaxi TaxID=504797 RepID=A0A1I3B0Q0_9ACTN|nr:alpha/beta hydrolase family protein [Actinopolymorpha cephalotaxi]SFH55905.1 Alpha/beta hydrolase family protein [Actinopolymorpha cephalotaxi]